MKIKFNYIKDSNGKRLSKYDIAYLLDRLHYRSLPWLYMYKAYSYSEMVNFYNSCLSDNL